jgi:hypothetical protein
MNLFAELQRLSDVRAAERRTRHDEEMNLRIREVEVLERIAAAAEGKRPAEVPSRFRPLNTTFRSHTS